MKRARGHRWAALCAAVVAMAWGAVEAASLPPGYTELAWIQSTGTQHINTGVEAGEHTTIDLRYGHVTYQNGGTIFGENNWGPQGFLYLVQGDKIRFFGQVGSDVDRDFMDADKTASVDYRIVFNADDTANLYLNGANTPSVTRTIDRTSAADDKHLYLFWCNNKYSTKGEFRVYSMKIGTDAGETLRDFVPCRTPEGVAGLYDLVEGKFYGNNGTGVFLGSDDPPGGLYLNYIAGTGTQWINTGVNTSNDTTLDLRFGHVQYAAGTEMTIFGEDCHSFRGFLFIFQADQIRFFGNGDEADWKFLDADTTGLADYRLVFKSGDLADLYLNGETTPTVANKSIDRTTESTDSRLMLFHQNPSNGYTKHLNGVFRLYSMLIGNDAGATLRDFVPYRTSDGQIGLLDRANNNTFYSNNGTGTFGWSLAYLPNGTTCRVYMGTLTDADMAGWTAIEKTSGYVVTATAATTFPALTLAQGKFNLQDGAPTARTVTGALKLKSGAVLAIDFTNDGCDSFTAGSVDLSEVSAGHPVLVQLRKGEGVDLARTYTLIASGVTEEDAAKFVTDDPELTCHVVDGALMVGYHDTTLPVRATWKGTGSDPLNLADPANWTCVNALGEEISDVPMAETQVVLPANCSFICTNGAPFVCKELVLPSTLAGDCDLRGVKAPLVGTLNLKGHKLFLSSLNGAATITDGDAAYERLEYIEGNGFPYIDTGVQAGSDTTLDMSFGHVKYAPGTEMTIFGQNLHAPNGFLFLFQADKIRFFGKAGTENDWNFTDADSTGERDYRLVFHPDSTASLYVDGEETPTVNRKAIDRVSSASDKRLYLFYQNTDWGKNVKGYRGRYRLYSMKIGTNAGGIVRDYVPVRRLSDGQVGLLDLVHGDPAHDEFYGNDALSGGLPDDVFHAGPVVEGLTARGEVHLDVPADAEVVNSSVTLSGTLKLVKEGAGTFVPAVRTVFSGGFDVLAGTVRGGIKGTSFGYGAPSTEIFVGTNAVFDVNGQVEFTPYNFVLAKGTLRNSGANASYSRPQLGNVRLTDDARFEIPQTYGMVAWNASEALIDLGGHTLEVVLSNGELYTSFWLANTTVRNGTLKVTGSGYLHTNPNLSPSTLLENVTLDVSTHTCAEVGLTVLNYIADVPWTESTAIGKASFTVTGRFTPKGDYGSVTLQDKATIDVSARNAPAPIQSLGKLTFADGATIYVDVGKRTMAGDEPVISWTDATKPANLDGLDFQPPPGKRYCVFKGATGVFVQRGMLILVR